jgi:hypothetical protein
MVSVVEVTMDAVSERMGSGAGDFFGAPGWSNGSCADIPAAPF